MKLLQKISYRIDCLSRYAAYLAIGLVLACALVSVGNALSRY
ncbi:MAG: sugar transporter, partial [Burkholderiaceae bacterium]|nr:sugar transporter [Burkholderiaceae bacterium]